MLLRSRFRIESTYNIFKSIVINIMKYPCGFGINVLFNFILFFIIIFFLTARDSATFMYVGMEFLFKYFFQVYGMTGQANLQKAYEKNCISLETSIT